MYTASGRGGLDFLSTDSDEPANDDPLRLSGWKRWLSWLPCVLLVVVAVVQITLTRTADLVPWKGGGFGMFATRDSLSSRHLRLTALAGSQWVPIRVPSAFQNDADRAVSMPTDAELRRFAEILIAEGPPASLRALRIEVLRFIRDPKTGAYSFAPINAYKRDFNGPG